MATVYQRNDFFYAKSVDVRGKRTSRSTGVARKRDAQRPQVEGSEIIIRPKWTAKSRRSIPIPMPPPVVFWIPNRLGAFFPELGTKATLNYSTNFPRLMVKAGVAREVTMPWGVKTRRALHSLRHSFASWLGEADVHSDVPRRLTGHRSEGVHNRYTHHDESLVHIVGELPFDPPFPPQQTRHDQ